MQLHTLQLGVVSTMKTADNFQPVAPDPAGVGTALETHNLPRSCARNTVSRLEVSALEHFYVTCAQNRVAEGVILPSGAFALSWFGDTCSHGTYPSLDIFRRIQAQMSGREIVRGDGAARRTFYLQRNEDWNGISGTGIVAVGFDFGNMAVLQWRGENGSTFWYDSVERVDYVHGHGGRTIVVRVDK